MSVKEHVLEILLQKTNVYCSGEELAEQLFVSRTAIWKAIKQLQKEGYEIMAVPNKGYALADTSDVLSKQSIEANMKRKDSTFSIEVYKTVTSTNNLAKEKALLGAAEGTVILAEEQTEGRGRNGREFFSPSESGIYMTFILRPEMVIVPAWLTTAAAVAVAEAVEEISGCQADIKWVNDIYLENQKICGILTEGSISMENGGLEYAVVGIGINVNPPNNGFPDELKTIATSIFKKKGKSVRSLLVAKILENFWAYYKKLPDLNFFNGYRERMFLIGKDVEVSSFQTVEYAKVMDLDRDFSLVVQMENGEIRHLSSGEVRIRWK